jgi:hypothetical protein
MTTEDLIQAAAAIAGPLATTGYFDTGEKNLGGKIQELASTAVLIARAIAGAAGPTKAVPSGPRTTPPYSET